MLFGVRPWQDEGAFYSLVCYSLGALVIAAVGSEFAAQPQSFSGIPGGFCFASMLQLTRRNTRRYGGYIVHFGIVVMFIGFAGATLQPEHREKRLGVGGQRRHWPVSVGLAKLHAGFQSQLRRRILAVGRVPRRKEDHSTRPPSVAFYQASATAQTIVANHSTLAWGFFQRAYSEGKNPTWPADHQSILSIRWSPGYQFHTLAYVIAGEAAVALTPR